MEKVLCKNCKCWDTKADGSGVCHRHAPTPIIVKDTKGDQYMLVVPSTLSNDGCFEGIEA